MPKVHFYIVTQGRLCGSLRRLAMVTQAELQALLGGGRISAMIKSMGSHSLRILQRLHELS